MWLLISRLLLLELGVAIDMALMCLLQIGKEADRDMEYMNMKRRNDE